MSPSDIEVRQLQPGEEEAVAELVMRVFTDYVGPGYSDEGVAEFAEYSSAPTMGERLQAGESTAWVALVDGSLAGMVEFRGADHVSLMFVEAAHHGLGIATQLFEVAREQLDSDEITVNSSPYAVPVYERLGFVTAGSEQTVNGITFIPMRYNRSTM